MQDEISDAVTIAVVPAVADAELRRAMRKPPGSLDARAAYQAVCGISASSPQTTTQSHRSSFNRQSIWIPTLPVATGGCNGDRFQSSQGIVLPGNVHPGRFGIKTIPDQLGERLYRWRLRLTFKEVLLDFDNESLLRHPRFSPPRSAHLDAHPDYSIKWLGLAHPRASH
jgi:hypothetical protein